MTTNLVVADPTRTEKTICLAVTPALKQYGIPGRARLYEVKQKARGVDFIIAPPKMKKYMEISTKIFSIYASFIAPRDIHVYSVDEVFMDLTHYLKNAKMSAADYVRKIVRTVYEKTGITATAGLGTNLYLCKVAMDIVAKRVQPDADGVRIAELTEMEYRRQLWDHRPLTDFWRVGRGYQRKLEKNGIFTMGDIARCSLGNPNEFHNEDLL